MMRLVTPSWGRMATAPHTWRLAGALVLVMCATALPAAAQPKARPAPVAPATSDAKPAAAKPKPSKEQNFNFEGLGLNGRSRSPQLLIFLERANEELERASLEKRSFIPHLVRSVEEEAL